MTSLLLYPKIFREWLLIHSSVAAISAALTLEKSVPFGCRRLIMLLAFSLLPLSHEEYGWQ